MLEDPAEIFIKCDAFWVIVSDIFFRGLLVMPLCSGFFFKKKIFVRTAGCVKSASMLITGDM